MNKLSGPWGDWRNYNVSVFTTEGVYMTSFGREGSGEGDLKGPRGLRVDRDGLVCVCDRDNHRIQVFKMLPSSINAKNFNCHVDPAFDVPL